MFIKDTNITKEQVMTQLNNLDRNKTTVEADLKNVTEWDVSPGKFNVTLEGQSYRFSKWAQSQLLKKLRIPVKYFNMCSEELRNEELKEGFVNLQKGSENKFKIWVNPETQEQMVYGFIPMKCRDMLSGEITEQVFNGLGSQDGVFINECDIELDHMRIRFVSNAHSYTDVDEEFPGVDFIFSEVLKDQIQLQSVLYRKVCSNGLVIPQEINQSFKMPLPHFKPDIFDLQIQYVDNATSGLESITRTIEALKQIELPAALINADKDERNLFDDVFEYVLPSRPLRSDYGQLIRAEYNQENNLTVNGIVNATTKIARDIKDETKTGLESSAGMFVSKIAVMDEHTRESGGTFDYTKEGLDKIFKKKKKKLGSVQTNS